MAAELAIKVQTEQMQQAMALLDGMPKSMQKIVVAGTAVGNEMEKAGRKGKSAWGDVGTQMDKLGDNIMRHITLITGIGAAVGLAKKEWEDYMSRIKAAAATQVAVSQARATAMLQLPPDMRPQEADKLVSEVAGETGMSEKDIWLAAGEAFSSKGALSKGALKEAMITAGRITQATGGAVPLGTLSGSVMDLQGATGVTGAGSGGQMLGWIQQFGSAARITDLRAQAKALAPTVKTAQEMGVAPERTAELLATATQMSGDATGEKSATGTVNFIKRIMEMKGLKGAGFEERLASAQGKVAGMGDDQRTKFFDDFGGEANMQGFVRGMLNRSPQAMQQLANAQGAITAPTDPSLTGLGNRFLDTVGGSSLAMPAEAKAAMDKLKERSQLGDTRALKGQIGGQLDETLSGMGLGWAQRKAADIAFATRTGLGENPATAAIGIAAAAAGRSEQGADKLMPALTEFMQKMDKVAQKFLEAAATEEARKKNPKLFATDAGL